MHALRMCRPSGCKQSKPFAPSIAHSSIRHCLSTSFFQTARHNGPSRCVAQHFPIAANIQFAKSPASSPRSPLARLNNKRPRYTTTFSKTHPSHTRSATCPRSRREASRLRATPTRYGSCCAFTAGTGLSVRPLTLPSTPPVGRLCIAEHLLTTSPRPTHEYAIL